MESGNNNKVLYQFLVSNLLYRSLWKAPHSYKLNGRALLMWSPLLSMPSPSVRAIPVHQHTAGWNPPSVVVITTNYTF